MNTIVSIIIPAYNRAHLLPETLDSIIGQNYKYWECLVVDDGSTDDSDLIYKKYKEKDNRFRFLVRPSSKKKGANSCRNIGLQNATGDFIVFFDSDDLMTEDHLKIKVDGMIKYSSDYVITRTRFLNSNENYIDDYYKFDTFELTAYNYISQKLNWLTYDICIKRELAQAIQFNEELQSGQEYNYFSKLVLKSINARFLNSIVTLRRKHDGSIRANIKTEFDLNNSVFKTTWLTYRDIKNVSDYQINDFLISRCTILIYQLKSIPVEKKSLFTTDVFRHSLKKGFYFLCMLLSLKLFDKGYWFRRHLEHTQ